MNNLVLDSINTNGGPINDLNKTNHFYLGEIVSTQVITKEELYD